jgi:hypothetical protein
VLTRVTIVLGCSLTVMVASSAPALAGGGWGGVDCGQNPNPGCELGTGTGTDGGQGAAVPRPRVAPRGGRPRGAGGRMGVITLVLLIGQCIARMCAVTIGLPRMVWPPSPTGDRAGMRRCACDRPCSGSGGQAVRSRPLREIQRLVSRVRGMCTSATRPGSSTPCTGHRCGSQTDRSPRRPRRSWRSRRGVSCCCPHRRSMPTRWVSS